MHLPRRFLSITVAACLLLSGISAAPLAWAFNDVRSQTPYARAIQALQDRGVIQGYSDGTFKPSATINRAEFLKIVISASGLEAAVVMPNCFPDVTDQWFVQYVCLAKQLDIVSGYDDGLFRPERTINFVEAAKILSLAYGQQVESSGEWYEGYARALESSKAIPPSITGLEKLVTRGEMAEMMWRLTEGVTDQPSKGYLNVKYPSLAVNLASEQPLLAKSCGDLGALAQEAQQTGITRGRLLMFEDLAVPTGTTAPLAAKQSEAQQSGDYSRTNVQVEGVDESDIVKTDGTYLYTVQNDTIRIIQASPASAMRVVSTIDLSDSVFTPSELYLEGDRLTVIGSGWKDGPVRIMQKVMPSIYPPIQSVQRTQLRIYDVSDRSNPKLSRKLEFDGSLVSSRRIDDRMYLVMNQGFRWVGPMPLYREADVLPTYVDSAKGETEQPVARCGDVTILPHVPEPEYLIVATVPLQSATAEVKKEVIVGSADNLYASTDNLYVAANEQTYYWREGGGTSSEKTHLYRFAFTDDGVAFKAKGEVPGHILNQFSMDENGETFRIATTVTRAQEPPANDLYVLNKDLTTVGSITDIAPGEQIYSTRFLGDRAYMVTFKNTDPLFVIDTSDPRNPRIIGKLKIPGYSNYLHPYDENHILGFGKEAEDSKDGNFAWYQGMKVALFDVTDPSNPVSMSQVTIGDRGTQSPLLSNHKALLFDRARNLLAFPVSVAKISDAAKQQGSWDSPTYGDTVFQGAYVYDVSLSGGLKLRGSITHYGEDDALKAGSYLYGKDIERIVRIGDSFLTVGQDRVVSSVEQTLVPEGHVLYE